MPASASSPHPASPAPPGRGGRRRRGVRTELRVYALGLVMLLACGALIARLWWVQVARGEEYRKRIAGRSEVRVRIPSVRGEIRDRNGVPLVTNRASYEVDFYLPDMVRGYKERTGGQVPQIAYQAPVKGMMANKREADIVQIVNTAVVPRLQELDLAKDYNSRRLKTHYRNDTEIPFTYLEDIDFNTIAKFSEHDVGLPGVDISIRPVRQYLYGALAAHLLGYVGMPRNIDLEPDIHDYNFYAPDVDGKNQIEQQYDKLLRGKPGTRFMSRSIKNVIEGEVRTIPATPGNNVYLTIDTRIQMIAEQALRHPALGRAAAVVLDPNNGDILAMASIPSFDPNIFIPSISEKDWDALRKDEGVPLVNRAVSGFPPGSTFKIVTALAGLNKGLANAHYGCSGGWQIGDRFFHCWIAEKHGAHGVLGLADSLKVSCDAFFYQYGIAAGIDTIDKVGALLGIGQKYDIGLTDEKEGVMPGPEWMKVRFPREKWTNAYTANVSIGQGYVLASPLQMAMAYATVANGGVAYSPRLVKKVLTPEGKPALDDEGNVAVPDEPKVRGDLRKVVSAQQIEIVRKGLWEVVNEKGGPGGGGTGGKAQIKGTVVAGKTGTAQATDRGHKENIAWFCCFAPYDKPKYVIAVMVQGGKHGGSVAGPIAARILDQCLAMDQGNYSVQLAALKPATSTHPFAAIEALDYKENAPALGPSDAETTAMKPASGDNAPDMASTSRARPDIRPSADEQGRVSRRATPASPGVRPPPGAPAEQPQFQQQRGVLDRIFHRNRPAAPQSAPASQPQPQRPRSHWPF